MQIDFSGRFYTILTKITDLILLNLLFLVCCLPIVTIGASFTAMYYVTLKMSANRDAYLFRSFFQSFKENFRQSTIIWLILLAAGILIGLDIRIMLTQDIAFKKVFLYLLAFAGMLLTFVLQYIFPVLSKFYNTIKATFKNALLMSLRHLPFTLLMLLVSALPYTLFLTDFSVIFRMLPVVLLCGFSGPAYINSYFLKKIFAHYIPEEDRDEDEISGE